MVAIQTDKFDIIIKKSSVFVATKDEVYHLGNTETNEIVLYDILENFKKDNKTYIEFKDPDIIFRFNKKSNTFEASIQTRFKLLTFEELFRFDVSCSTNTAKLDNFYKQ